MDEHRSHGHSHGGHQPPAHDHPRPRVQIGEPSQAEGMWTCPMHPQVLRPGPGACPKCGMALERVMPTLDDGPNHELEDMTRRLWVSITLTVPVLVVAMSEMIPGAPLQHAVAPWLLLTLQALLSTPVVLWGGWPFFVRGWDSPASEARTCSPSSRSGSASPGRTRSAP